VYKKLRNYFLTGIIVLLPITATLYILYWLFKFVDGFLGGFFKTFFGVSVPGSGVLFTLVIILVSGFLATNFLGKKLIGFGETIVSKIPLVNTIYTTIKQIVDAFLYANKMAFTKVVMVEYPRKDCYALGFVTGEFIVKDRKLLSVFVPTTPNPTSGILLIFPEEDVNFLSISAEEGIKLIISGGLVGDKKINIVGEEEENDAE
jgi:uncharacterized membrane protein